MPAHLPDGDRGRPGRTALAGLALGAVLVAAACTDRPVEPTSTPSTLSIRVTDAPTAASDAGAHPGPATTSAPDADTAAGLEDVPEVARRG